MILSQTNQVSWAIWSVPKYVSHGTHSAPKFQERPCLGWQGHSCLLIWAGLCHLYFVSIHDSPRCHMCFSTEMERFIPKFCWVPWVSGPNKDPKAFITPKSSGLMSQWAQYWMRHCSTEKYLKIVRWSSFHFFPHLPGEDCLILTQLSAPPPSSSPPPPPSPPRLASSWSQWALLGLTTASPRSQWALHNHLPTLLDLNSRVR